MRRRGRRSGRGGTIAAWLFIAAVLIGLWGWMGNDVMIDRESEEFSESRGSINNGFLLHGKRLPTSGDNFHTYSRLLSSFGRTCVHEQVRGAMLDSYAALYEENPDYTFVYGETGWCGGGSFWPHKTHQNGLSVDFMVPVKRDGRSVPPPTTVLDGWGYASEYDDGGKMGEFQIDFEAMAAHLWALRQAARKNGLRIDRVILEPSLHPELFAAKGGKRVKRRIDFMETSAWVRHDDHYHVDFVVQKQHTKVHRKRKQKLRERKKREKQKQQDK